MLWFSVYYKALHFISFTPEQETQAIQVIIRDEHEHKSPLF